MITRLIVACLATMMIANTALAGRVDVVPAQLSIAGLERFSTAARNFYPMVRQAGYYCRRDCDYCRENCYARFRVYCGGYNCRRLFSQCMKGCWNNICRYC